MGFGFWSEDFHCLATSTSRSVGISCITAIAGWSRRGFGVGLSFSTLTRLRLKNSTSFMIIFPPMTMIM